MFNSDTYPVVHNHLKELIRLKRKSVEDNRAQYLNMLQTEPNFTCVVRDLFSIHIDLGLRSGKNTFIGANATLRDVVLSEDDIYNSNGKTILCYRKEDIMANRLQHMLAAPDTVYVNDASWNYVKEERNHVFKVFGSINTIFVFLG